MQILKKLAMCAALLGATAVSAQSLDNTYTYSGLRWAFSTSHAGFSSCDTLLLDATGAVYSSDYFSAYGRLNCSALGGSYPSSGSAHFDSFGSFNISISLGVTHNLVCTGLNSSTFSGSCPIMDNLGTQTGTAFITFL